MPVPNLFSSDLFYRCNDLFFAFSFCRFNSTAFSFSVNCSSLLFIILCIINE
ncbi:hypothetical protein Barb6_00301 [Bacteroidales bacterium Barb6]|nr:hypothetical protein Barb6_00301 [Bacteroidales bacterium Barb6]